MSKTVTYRINYQLDKQSLNEIKNSLQQLQKLTSKDMMNLDPHMSLTKINAQLKEIKDSAAKVETAFNSAFNADLGTLNIAKFNNELKNSDIDINKVYKDFQSAGTVGESAFRNISSQILTTNLQLKQSHKILDDVAITMKNTV